MLRFGMGDFLLMNRSVIRFILGNILKIEGLLMALPCIIALIYGEKEGFSYLIVGFISTILGLIITSKTKRVYYLFKRWLHSHIVKLDSYEYCRCVAICIDKRNPFFYRCFIWRQSLDSQLLVQAF